MQRGFTLIELLVVIAIIGILAATVLAALGTARQGGSNASVKGSVSSMRAQAELFFTANSNTYANVCADTAFANLLTAARSNGQGGTSATVVATGAVWSTAAASNRVHCNSTASAWVVQVPLQGSAANYFCVDSTGAAKEGTAAAATGVTVCP